MKPDAARSLAAVLEDENAALRVLDIARVADLVGAKRAAVQALAGGAPAGVDVAMAERLHVLANDNRRLLERAMAVQSRVVALLAEAMKPPVAAPRYARNGTMMPAREPRHTAFSARA